MSSLGSSTSTYNFSDSQANIIGAPVGANMFGEIDQVFSRDNASTKAHYGTSTTDAISYDAANRQFFNDTMELGVDCGRLNMAAGRPDVAGGRCYPPSISAQRASKQMNASYNSYGPSAEQIVLAEGDIRYAPSRFADQNNYKWSVHFGPVISAKIDGNPRRSSYWMREFEHRSNIRECVVMWFGGRPITVPRQHRPSSGIRG